jgi:D-alanine transaminase
MPAVTPPCIVYLNGRFISKDESFISTDDRGFYFADGVYEVIKYYKGQSFSFEDHMIRLRNSLSSVRIDFDVSMLGSLCDQLIRDNLLEDEYAGVYIQITRGVAPRIHRFPDKGVKPTLFVRAFTMPSYVDDLRNGIRVITREDIRWLRCDVKSIALLPNTILFQEAVEQNAGECFLVRDGNYTEATHSNIMAVIGGTVYTHPDTNLILPGITKKVIIRICDELCIPLTERPVASDETSSFDECFITGTGSEVMPVVEIDGKPVGNGKPGPVTIRLQEEFFKITYGRNIVRLKDE